MIDNDPTTAPSPVQSPGSFNEFASTHPSTHPEIQKSAYSDALREYRAKLAGHYALQEISNPLIESMGRN